MKFRPDIESLRAIAVLIVILYHAFPTVVPGGFIGVDVFFVISGFLMTSIIIKRSDQGAFSFLSFYGSRMRRIFPALFVCVLIVYVLAFYTGNFGSSVDTLRRPARSAIFGFSNFYFYTHTDYFDLATNSQIFLHTWSLGVELQFYLLYPIFLLGLRKFLGISFKQTIVALLLVSFAISCFLVYVDQTAAFYLLPSRLWEFLVGGYLAMHQWTPRRPMNRNILLWSGVTVILFLSLFQITSFARLFPGFMALGPIIGASLFILGGNNQEVSGQLCINKLLFNSISAFIGKISYSLYLWHWPILLLLKTMGIDPALSEYNFVIYLILIFVFAYISWKYIETPIRQHSERAGWGRQLIILLASLAIFATVNETFKHISPVLFERQRSYFDAAKDGSPYSSNDILGDKSQPVSFLLLGDSHAAAISQVLSRVAKQNNIAGRLLTSNSPFLNAYSTTHKNLKPPKPEFYTKDAYEIVYIAMRWPMYAHGFLPSETHHPQPLDGYMHYIHPTGEYHGIEAISYGLKDTIDFLLNLGVKRIYLLLPIPEHRFEIPGKAGSLSLFLEETEINNRLSITFDEYLERNHSTLKMLKEIATLYEEAVTLLDPVPLLKLGDRFRVLKDGKPLYFDDDHLSTYGAQQLSPLFSFKP